MAMTRRLLDGDLVDRMVTLADLPWSLRAYEETFVRNGWHMEGDDGEIVIGWLDVWPVVGEEGVDDWWLLLGEYPGCQEGRDAVCAHPQCRAGCWVAMPFAYFADPDDPEAWEREQGPFFARADCLPQASAADFEAEYVQAGKLLRARLGEPLAESPYRPDGAKKYEVWERGDSWVVLLVESDPISYHAYDQAVVEVRPRV
ncbi:hypothetical protein DN051_36725 [Streptomyces cadmiisoli]|uniref:Uncharacterized protein n=2 Tax=Streptomyces cadmiisoli TaxID=2184053 RepID=A0A2Z4JAY5_9ACTN|nr:hypothetical protein DN051_36725 [Streptomyces cadmiisoli]